VFASGSGIFYTTPKGREAISQPDDITSLGGDNYVGFQNGVGPQGQASTTGNICGSAVSPSHLPTMSHWATSLPVRRRLHAHESGRSEQIFVSGDARRHHSLSVLMLTHSVDDTAWPSGRAGALYATDNGADTIYKVTGGFTRGSPLVAVTPCDQNDAPGTCPGPGFPANYLGELNPCTGNIAPVHVDGRALQPQGMLFLAP
jgi:hypothetical protein